MKINRDDILFMIESGFSDIANQYLNEEADALKENKQYSDKNINNLLEKYAYENVLNSEHSVRIIQTMIIAAISEYHEQLREKLLERGIDIGEIDTETTPLRNGDTILRNGDEYDL